MSFWANLYVYAILHPQIFLQQINESNLNILLKLLFYLPVTTNNNLPFTICYKSIMEIL